MRQYLRFRGLRALPWTSGAHRHLHTASNISDLTSNIFTFARRLFRAIHNSRVPVNPKGGLGGARQPGRPRVRSQSVVLHSNDLPSSVGSLREVARSLFVNNVLKRVTNFRNNTLRRRTAQELLGGNSAPFLALVGVSLASGNGILTKEDEIESVSHEVRNAIRKTRQEIAAKDHKILDSKKDESWSLADFDIGPVISKGCSAVVYAATCIRDGFVNIGEEEQNPLAMKMMFNFHAESNAQVIFKAMKKETIVAQEISCDGFTQNEPKIAAHPNIVKMHLAFSDYVPSLSESMDLYPHALPPRINPSGYGRNMSLFMVMKRYKCNLRDYLNGIHDFPWRSRLMLLTQILEGLVHLSRYKIAHRDLKTDNILVDCGDKDAEDQLGTLVLSDFGCCWYNPSHGFKCPYPTEDVDKGGNAALMAPEVANAVPGLFSFIDYSKADIWAAGALAYEVFGLQNPFYGTKKNRGLDSRSYE